MISALILDLDGTVYRGREEVPGAAQFIGRMRADGLRCLFVTNRASRPVSAVCEQIASYGIPCAPGEVLTTAEVAAAYVGKRSAYLIGEAGIRDEFTRNGIRLDDQAPDCVVVSLDSEFNYAKLLRATRLIRAGAEFVLTNPDAWLPGDDGPSPGAGALAAAVEVACGVKPTVLGKPEGRLFAMAVQRLGVPPGEILVIGDNLPLDVGAAHRAGLRAALILTGVTTRADLVGDTLHPQWVVNSFAELETLIQRENQN